MTPRQRIERLRKRGVLSSDGYDGMAADIRTALALLDEWEKALREYTDVVSSVNDPTSFAPKVRDEGYHARTALALLDKESP